ncbi:MAG: MFS transporter [Chloroflexi bacterium]|nr:MFS transporter [Chloroflexota bacterium]
MRRLLTPFLMLCMVGLVARLGYQMARSPVLPRFAQDLGAAPELVGLILGASTITGIFIKLPAGALSDVLGRRRMMLLGAFFFAFPPFLYLVVESPCPLLALRFLHGFATAIFSPVASAAVADLFAAGRGERLGWFASANEVGSATAPVLGGIILSFTAQNYDLVFLLVAALGLLTFLLVLLLPVGSASNRVPVKDGESRWQQFRSAIVQVVSDRQVLSASSMEAALFLSVGALVGFLPLYATQVAGLSDAQVGVVLGCQLVTALAGKPLAGRLSDRVGRKPMILAGLLLCALMLPLIGMTRQFILLVVEGALFGLGMAVVTPATTALVADLSKAGGHGAALGVFGTIWDMGEALGPILVGVLIGTFAAAANAYLPTFTVVSGVMLVSALVFAATVHAPGMRGVQL